MRKLEAASYRSLPWKDGGGTTIEVTRSPEGSSLDDFDWRISMARVAAAGTFSRFDDVDRSLVVLGGGALALSVSGRAPVQIDTSSAPLHFPGDVSVAAALPSGPVDDFNAMTRRGRFRHLLSRLRADKSVRVTLLGDSLVLVVVAGEAEARQGSTRVRLGARDALIVVRGEDAVELVPTPEVELLATDLWQTAKVSPARPA